jgi:hypothetical protein
MCTLKRVLFPCPNVRRYMLNSSTEYLRRPQNMAKSGDAKVRISSLSIATYSAFVAYLALDSSCNMILG